MTTVNATLLTAAMAFIGTGVTLISTNLWGGIASFAIGIVAIVVYEKLPPSTASASGASSGNTGTSAQ